MQNSVSQVPTEEEAKEETGRMLPPELQHAFKACAPVKNQHCNQIPTNIHMIVFVNAIVLKTRAVLPRMGTHAHLICHGRTIVQVHKAESERASVHQSSKQGRVIKGQTSSIA